MGLDIYNDIPSWHTPEKSLKEYLKLSPDIASWSAHDDPGLHTEFACGGANSPRDASIFKIVPGDFLTFIAHLAYSEKPGRPEPAHERSGWYLVGCLKAASIDKADIGNLHADQHSGHPHAQIARYHGGAPAHWGPSIIVQGMRNRPEQRFDKAVPLLTEFDCCRLVRDKSGQPPTFKEGQSVKARMVHYTRTGRCIGDTEKESDTTYLKALKGDYREPKPRYGESAMVVQRPHVSPPGFRPGLGRGDSRVSSQLTLYAILRVEANA